MGMFLADGAGTFNVDSALQTGSKLIEWVLGIIADNPLMAAAFCMAILIPAGIGAFRSLKSAV